MKFSGHLWEQDAGGRVPHLGPEIEKVAVYGGFPSLIVLTFGQLPCFDSLICVSETVTAPGFPQRR